MTNLNIRLDKEDKLRAESIFKSLGMNMTTAVTLFLKTVIRTNGIPFDLTLNTPNQETAEAIAEGRRMVADSTGVGYHTRSSLIDALDS